jgi:hypothetical protein
MISARSYCQHAGSYRIMFRHDMAVCPSFIFHSLSLTLCIQLKVSVLSLRPHDLNSQGDLCIHVAIQLVSVQGPDSRQTA